MKIIKISPQNQITIPKYFRRKFPEEFLLALETEEGLLLKPVKADTKFKIVTYDSKRGKRPTDCH